MKYLSLFSGIGGFELGIQQAWNALNVKNKVKFTKVDESVQNASLNITESGEKRIEKNLTLTQEKEIKNAEIKSSKHMVLNASVAEKQRPSFSRLITKKITETQKDEESEEGESITKLLNKDSQINIRSSVITATSQKDSMDNAPICVGFSEIDRYAIQIYEKHFSCTTHTQQQEKGVGDTKGRPSECTDKCANRFGGSPHKNYGDITKIKAEELPEFDLLVGGFPCQSFSIAGKRGGFNDTRGTLFFEIARILKAKQPHLLLLENVKGLLSHDEGRTFATIISTLDELGYDLQWQVLNSKNFGVPQNRERVFIVGHIRGTSRPEVFPIGEPTKDSFEQGGGITGTN